MNIPFLIHLLEAADEPKATFGCAMLEASPSFKEGWPAHIRGLVEEGDLSGDGFEDDPHVTVLGLTYDEPVGFLNLVSTKTKSKRRR